MKKKIKSILFTPNGEAVPSLYPFDGIGIYDRERFIRVGGYDNTLTSTHWQLMDFGFRSHLWGEEIFLSQQLKLSYDGTASCEDNTAEDSYRRFYFKNLAPVFRGDYAHLPLRRFLRYMLSPHSDLNTAWEDFSESRRWVNTNRFRWRCDPETLTGRWNGVSVGDPLFKT